MLFTRVRLHQRLHQHMHVHCVFPYADSGRCSVNPVTEFLMSTDMFTIGVDGFSHTHTMVSLVATCMRCEVTIILALVSSTAWLRLGTDFGIYLD